MPLISIASGGGAGVAPIPGDPHFGSVVLLVPGDNDGDDVSSSNHTPTFGADVSTQSGTVKFGPNAMDFVLPGSDPDYITYPDSEDWHLTGQFTIETWVRLKADNTTRYKFVSQYLNTGNNRSWYFEKNPSKELNFWSSTNGSTGSAVSGTWNPVANTWYHVAVTRDVLDNVRLFVDGTQTGSTTSVSGALFSAATELRLGFFKSDGFDNFGLDGFLEDVRITNGVARWTANFTPPTSRHLTG